MKYLAIIILLATAFQLPATVQSSDITWSDVEGWIDIYAAQEGVSSWWMHNIAMCEAQGDPYAIGSLGEVGPFQWRTNNGALWWQTPAGRQGISPWNIEMNVAMAAYALARGYQGHWSCA